MTIIHIKQVYWKGMQLEGFFNKSVALKPRQIATDASLKTLNNRVKSSYFSITKANVEKGTVNMITFYFQLFLTTL